MCQGLEAIIPLYFFPSDSVTSSYRTGIPVTPGMVRISATSFFPTSGGWAQLP